MKVTQEILDALEKLQEQVARELGKTDTRGCQQAICKQIGLSSNYLYRIKLGQTIVEKNWSKLSPLLRPYLSTQFDPMAIDGKSATQQQHSEPEKPLTQLTDIMTQLVPNAQHVIAGVINVHGVPNDKITTAIKQSSLTEEQKKELILRIFS